MRRARAEAGWSCAVVIAFLAGCAPGLMYDNRTSTSDTTTSTGAGGTKTATGSGGAATSTGAGGASTGGSEPCGTVTGQQDTGTSAPVVAGPASGTVHAGASLAVTGIGITDAMAAANPGSMVVAISVKAGTIAMTANSAEVPGSGTSSIMFSSSLSAINAALATLTYTAPGAATADVLQINPTDQYGMSNALFIPITVTSPAMCHGNGGAGGSGSATSSASSTSSTGGGGGAVGDPTGTTAVQTLKVVGGFGMNIHTTCCQSAYDDLTALAGDIDYIWGTSGATPILRDSPNGNSNIVTWWPQLASATGAKFDAYIAELPPSAYQTDLDLMRKLPHGIVLAYEGPNEPDSAYNNGICPGSATACLQAAASYMPTVWAAGKADGVSVFQTTFGNIWPDPGTYGSTGDLSAYADYGNAHTYFNTGSGSRAPSQGGVPYNHGPVNWVNHDAALTTPGKPVAISEFGYTVSGGVDAVTQYVQGVYIQEVIFDAFMLGNPYYFYYALYDDGSGAWGVFNTDHTPRASATDLQNLFAILGDQGKSALTFAPGKLDFTLTGMPTSTSPGMGGNQLLLQKSNGDFELVLYNEQNINAGEGPVTNVTLTFGAATMKSVDVFDPTLGKASQQHLTNVTSMTVPLPQHPIVLEIVHP